jgi:hypothetical protein
METRWSVGPSQEALHDWPIGFALGQGRGIAVLVHCGGNMRVSHEFVDTRAPCLKDAR